MSTRGWYDYYVIDPRQGTLSLAMRFYKWGDATPENALAEVLRFREQLRRHDGRLPVEWLDQLLREQLGDLHAGLPPHFTVAAFLFLLQRATEEEEREHWLRGDPPDQRPDFHLRFALNEVLANGHCEIAPNADSLLEGVRRFIATARSLRPWRDYALRLDLLDWLQYLTQPTRSADMGSLAGDWQPHWDIAYQYRLFFWLDPEEVDPADPFRIGQMAIEMRTRDGREVLTAPAPTGDPDTDEWERKELERLRRIIRESDIGIASLAMLEHEYATTPDRFWRFREQPDPEETRRRARIAELRPACNMLLRQVGIRFGPEIAAQSRDLMAEIDDLQVLLALAAPVINSPDSDAWLAAVTEVVEIPAGKVS